MSHEQPTQVHQPVTDATRTDLKPFSDEAEHQAEHRSMAEHAPPLTESEQRTAERVNEMLVEQDKIRYPLIEVPPLANGDSVTMSMRYSDGTPIAASTAERIERTAAEMARPGGDPLERAPGPDYSDVESGVLRSIETAKMLAELRISGEEVDPAATEATVERIRALRYALGGIGQVGQHFNAVGTPVGDQVAVILTSHEIETLIMRLTGKARFGTI